MSNQFVDAGGWVVVDRLLVDFFRSQLAVSDADVAFGTVLDPKVEWPAVCVERLPGGGINLDGYEDLSRIQVTTYGRTRPESDSMTAQVRHLMFELSDEEWAGVGIDTIREETGPGRIPDIDQDVRAVPTTWAVVARNQG